MKQAEAYLRAVRRGLKDAPAEDRDRLMKRLTEAVSAYLEEDPEAGEADIIKAFGTPEACAAELLAECDPARVAEERRKRKLRYAAIAVLVAAAVILLAAVFLHRDARTLPADSDIPQTQYTPSYPPHSDHDSHESGHH